ncbi:MAG TPA: hypothetical protein VFO03_14245 [Gaiellaceae bacterium]|nr:hypothetical protein [Gaiellaceae bacterium]
MSSGLVTLLIGVGAGAIALWIDVRFPRLAPDEILKAVLHVAAALALGYAIGPALERLFAADDAVVVLVGVFGVAFPSIVYCFLTAIWFIKLAQRAMGAHLR